MGQLVSNSVNGKILMGSYYFPPIQVIIIFYLTRSKQQLYSSMIKLDSNRVKGKILLVSYYFPPIKAISSYRNYCLVKYFQNYFDAVEVVTTTNDFFLPRENLFLKDVKISRIPTLDYRTIFHSEKTSGVNYKGTKWHHSLRGLKNSFPFNFFLNLGGPLYIIFGIIIGFYRLKKSKSTHILSSFRPYADHIIAYFLKRLCPSIYWIADFNNLHIEPDNNSLFWPALQKKINFWIISRADMVSTVSKGLVPHLEVFNDNVVVLENCIDTKLAPSSTNINDKFTISYTGSLYPQQSMHALLKTLNLLIKKEVINKQQICLQYAGTSNTLWNDLVKEYQLEEISEDLGILSVKEARKVVKNSQINLLLTWTTAGLDGIIPAKFYDYIAAGHPILLLINGRKDVLWEDKFDALNAGIVCYENTSSQDKLIQFITTLYNKWQAGEPNEMSMNQKEVAKYFWSYQMPLFISKLKKEDLTQKKDSFNGKVYKQLNKSNRNVNSLKKLL